MSLVVYETKKSIDAIKFYRELEERTKTASLTTNPFTTKTYHKFSDKNIMFAIDIKPVYPSFYLYLIFPFIVGLIFNLVWLMIGSFVLFCFIGFFWSPFFYMLFIYFGLRKKGYKGKINFPGYSKALGFFLWGK